MAYKNAEEQREYQREWIRRRRAEFFCDKTCAWCGSDNELQLDHTDRQKKVSHRIWSWSAHRREQELKKCQILCLTCHLIKTNREWLRRCQHGTEHMYMGRGCRCIPCVRAASAARQRRRHQAKV